MTHELLQENGSPYPRGFKKISVVVNDERTTPPDQVEIEMKKLIEWYRREKGNIFPFQMAFEWHLRFEKIHPFENGNGRIGRFLMNKILISYGFPPMVLFSSNRQAYFNAIASTRDGRRQKYYTFMLESYLKSLLFFSQKK